MYQAFFGLEELPFELTPDPTYLFMTPQHREALGNLQYGLSSAKSITVLIGEAGTGKTTILRAALESEPCRHVRSVYLNNPRLTRNEFMGLLASRFDLGPDAAASKAVLLAELERRLRDDRSAGQTTALVIDEAQSLSDELLEEVRLLANIETASAKLLPLVIAGQPELAIRLNEPSLRQLKQRVALRCEITRFDAAQTASYVASRVRSAGGEPSRLFTREAIRLVHDRAGGIARTINVICDNALLTGFALGRKPVDGQVIVEVCQDFDILSHPAASTRFELYAPHSADPMPPGSPPHQAGASADAQAGDGPFAHSSSPRRFRFGLRRQVPAALQGRVR